MRACNDQVTTDMLTIGAHGMAIHLKQAESSSGQPESSSSKPITHQHTNPAILLTLFLLLGLVACAWVNHCSITGIHICTNDRLILLMFLDLWAHMFNLPIRMHMFALQSTSHARAFYRNSSSLVHRSMRSNSAIYQFHFSITISSLSRPFGGFGDLGTTNWFINIHDEFGWFDGSPYVFCSICICFIHS